MKSILYQIWVMSKSLEKGKTNRFVYYRPRFVSALCLVLEHKSAKLDLLAVTDTLRNRELLVSTGYNNVWFCATKTVTTAH